jgi:hypothetical protein
VAEDAARKVADDAPDLLWSVEGLYELAMRSGKTSLLPLRRKAVRLLSDAVLVGAFACPKSPLYQLDQHCARRILKLSL